MIQSFRFLKWSVLIGSLVALTHCATGPEVTRKDEREAFRERVQAYWQHRVDGKIEQAYQFELPAYREKTSILQYGNSYKIMKYLEANVREVRVEGEKGKAQIGVIYIMLFNRLMNKHLTKTEEENWVNIKGVWYRIPQGFGDEKKS
jgi:hypothetical protein